MRFLSLDSWFGEAPVLGWDWGVGYGSSVRFKERIWSQHTFGQPVTAVRRCDFLLLPNLGPTGSVDLSCFIPSIGLIGVLFSMSVCGCSCLLICSFSVFLLRWFQWGTEACDGCGFTKHSAIKNVQLLVQFKYFVIKSSVWRWGRGFRDSSLPHQCGI